MSTTDEQRLRALRKLYDLIVTNASRQVLVDQWTELVSTINERAPSEPAAPVDARDVRISVGDGYFARASGFIEEENGRQLQAYKRNSYLSVSMWRDGVRVEKIVHRLVAQAFCVKRSDEQTQVNHRDGDKLNNASENLEWCSPAENCIHSARVTCVQETRPVIGIRLSDGHEVRYASLEEATEHGFKRANIQKVINGERNHHGGYVWRDGADKGVREELAAQMRDASRYEWLRERVEVRQMAAVNGTVRPAIEVRIGRAFLDSRTPKSYPPEADVKRSAKLDTAIDAAIDAALTRQAAAPAIPNLGEPS